MVYGTCLPHNGPRPLYIPLTPYSAFILAKACDNWVGYYEPGLDNWILSLMAYHGQSKQSAITSAEPEAIDHPIFLYLTSFYYPTTFLKTSLKIS